MMNAGGERKLPHRPVLYQEIIHAIQPAPARRYVDGTVGAGGHAWGLLKESAPDGLLLGLDVDPQALKLAQERLGEFGERARLAQASYTTLAEQVKALGWEQVNGILLDLGASSMQFDRPERGFSFQEDGPLDMRFDPQRPLTAAEIVNEWDESELADLLYRYGEEKRSRPVAKAIVRARPLESTHQLAKVVAGAMKGRPGGIHPATRTFQALRIAVNGELEALGRALPQAVRALAPGGRLAVISFHSLEDRMVKQFFRRESQDCICPPEQPTCTCGHKASIKEINKRPIQAGEEEVRENPRARSAKLRVAEKIGSGEGKEIEY